MRVSEGGVFNAPLTGLPLVEEMSLFVLTVTIGALLGTAVELVCCAVPEEEAVGFARSRERISCGLNASLMTDRSR